MAKMFVYAVTVVCETEEQAENIIASRLGHDEDLGHPYTIEWYYLKDPVINSDGE